MENSSAVPQKELPYDPAILLVGIYPQELKTETQTDNCTSTYIAFFTTPKHKNNLSVYWKMNVENVVYTHNGMLFSH